MIDMKLVDDLCTKIISLFNPQMVLLFGSYAYGAPVIDSDVDLLVVLPFEGKSVHKSIEILNKKDPHFPIGLIVRTPKQIQDRINKNDYFIKEVFEKGKVLYEAPDSRMG
jgi:predicted nucleotidyltransferase